MLAFFLMNRLQQLTELELQVSNEIQALLESVCDEITLVEQQRVVNGKMEQVCQSVPAHPRHTRGWGFFVFWSRCAYRGGVLCLCVLFPRFQPKLGLCFIGWWDCRAA